MDKPGRSGLYRQQKGGGSDETVVALRDAAGLILTSQQAEQVIDLSVRPVPKLPHLLANSVYPQLIADLGHVQQVPAKRRENGVSPGPHPLIQSGFPILSGNNSDPPPGAGILR